MADKKITDLQLISSVTDSLDIPVDDTIQTYRATASQFFTYIRNLFKPFSDELANLQLTTAVASSALTIAVKTNAGTDPSSSDKVRVAMRSATLTAGSYTLREISAALSLVISSGSTLGQVSGQPSIIYVYLIDNAGALELAASHQFFPDDALVSTTAEGGAGAADSATVMYSTTARTNVVSRCIGYILNTQTTAGTWASAGTQIQLFPTATKKTQTVQVFTSGSGTYYTPAGCKEIEIELVGAGGGGSGSGTSPGNGGTGGDTTFGSLTGSGGVGGKGDASGSTGGAASGGDVNIPGGYGQDRSKNDTSTFGGAGGNSYFGGGGKGGNNAPSSGINGSANSGGGGGGAGCGGTANAGSGGGSGGYSRKTISNPAASYSYGVGAAGTAGTAGTSGVAGSAGAAGIIIVKERY